MKGYGFMLPNHINEIVEMAWCDKTSFDDIFQIYNISEKDVILIMRKNMKARSFRLWRKRVSGRLTKHHKKMREHSYFSNMNATNTNI